MSHLTINVSAACLMDLKNCNFYRRALKNLPFFVFILESGVMCCEEIKITMEKIC